jgi:hypothetical protein
MYAMFLSMRSDEPILLRRKTRSEVRINVGFLHRDNETARSAAARKGWSWGTRLAPSAAATKAKRGRRLGRCRDRFAAIARNGNPKAVHAQHLLRPHSARKAGRLNWREGIPPRMLRSTIGPINPRQTRSPIAFFCRRPDVVRDVRNLGIYRYCVAFWVVGATCVGGSGGRDFFKCRSASIVERRRSTSAFGHLRCLAEFALRPIR